MKKILSLLLLSLVLFSCNDEDDYPASLRGLWNVSSIDPLMDYTLNVYNDDNGVQRALVYGFSTKLDRVEAVAGEFFYNPETGVGLIKSPITTEYSSDFTFQAYRGDYSKLALTISKPEFTRTVDMHALSNTIDFPVGAWNGMILINNAIYDIRLVISDTPTESNYGTLTLNAVNPAESKQLPITRLSEMSKPSFSETGAYGMFIVKDNILQRLAFARYDVVSKRMWIVFEGGTSDMEYENNPSLK